MTQKWPTIVETEVSSVQKITKRPLLQNSRGKMVTTAQSSCVGQVGVGGNTPPSSPSHLMYTGCHTTPITSFTYSKSSTQNNHTPTNVVPPFIYVEVVTTDRA